MAIPCCDTSGMSCTLPRVAAARAGSTSFRIVFVCGRCGFVALTQAAAFMAGSMRETVDGEKDI